VPSSFSAASTTLAMSALKSAYRDRAKEQHPDRAPDAEKAEASQKFVQLNSDFDEALKLLEAGVRPVAGWTSPSSQYGSAAGEAHAGPTWQHPQHFSARPFVHSQPPQFDTYTRVKGHLIVWSSLFVFLTCFREFLVGTAGSTWAWTPSSSLNPFWVRRFKDEWASEVQEKKKEDKAKDAERRKKQLPQKTERGVPSFYQKRGISNVRKQYSPRGHGPSL